MLIFSRISFILVLTLVLAACSIHKIDIQQGNVIEEKQLEQLKIGMLRRQVVDILGTPLLQDPFRPDRWDYVYYFKAANKTPDLYQLTLFFEDEFLIDIETTLSERTAEDSDQEPIES